MGKKKGKCTSKAFSYFYRKFVASIISISKFWISLKPTNKVLNVFYNFISVSRVTTTVPR